MKALFIEYPNCSTCKRAKKYLIHKEIAFDDRHIVEQVPSVEELTTWLQTLAHPAIAKLFNTSGVVYREMGLKDKLPLMNDEEKIALLASNGKLIKRPMLILPTQMLVGFKEDVWDEALSSH